MAPARVPVELVWQRGHRRAFRLSSAIDPEGIQFPRELPFPSGEPAQARFALPGSAHRMTATVEVQPRHARFLALDAADRARVLAYFKERLALP